MEEEIDIAALRTGLGMTYAELGEILGGVHRTTIYRWEVGLSRPRGPARKLLRQLQVQEIRKRLTEPEPSLIDGRLCVAGGEPNR